MGIKHLIRNFILKIIFCKSEPDLELTFIREAYYFWKLQSKYNASHHTPYDLEKMQYTLLRENHVIEKGMSMRNPRKGFGQEKVCILLQRLNDYYNLYGNVDKDFIRYPLSTIKSYIVYTKKHGTQIPLIEDEYNKMISKIGFDNINVCSGIKEIEKEDILKKCNKDFRSILESRHSIRYFSNNMVSQNVIVEALKMASLTPSACNRQGWKTHVFQGNKCTDLLKWQGGCRGFENEIPCSILVTANLKAFLSYEVHQSYIDGGLYAMNLINSIHSLGLGCIPLSCGFNYSKLQELQKFDIPENEVPIVIIAFGHLQDRFNVAISTRKDISLTNTFH